MKDSKIAWTDHTFNPWWGCTKVSPGCANCYAETFAKRTGHEIWGKSPRRFFGDKHWAEPLKWNVEAYKTGIRKRVFCASMADVFEDHAELEAPRNQLWKLIELTPMIDWLILTKRPENIKAMMPRGLAFANVWLGTSVENQEQADKRIRPLMNIPASVHWLSCEPLIEPVLLRYAALVDWVICGGESGPGFRPMKLEWARSLRDQCKTTGKAFFMKQLASRMKDESIESLPEDLRIREYPK